MPLRPGGSAADQGYPCATAPPSAPGSNGSGGNTAGQCGTENVAGVSHTQKAASPQTVAQVAPAQHTGGTLPFTGLQLGVFVALGVLLIGGGLVLRASGRKRTDL